MPAAVSISRVAYLLSALVIFFTEVFIALYVKDDIIRPHVGDLLVVIMIYCFCRAVFNWSIWKVAILTLLFAYTIEVLQYFKIVELLGLQRSLLARVVIGTYFSWIDILAYTIGICIVLLIEKIIAGRKDYPV